ncbi:MAG: hypothetical protein KC560_09785, partial [Myxococcales bacterium]|nr:hypothetical protein [Myxococcales bacterium]
AIETYPLERAAARFERRRLRHALDAHRYRWSTWPASLADVAATGTPGAMAAPEPRAYSYAARGRDVELIAPAQGPDQAFEQRGMRHPLGATRSPAR